MMLTLTPVDPNITVDSTSAIVYLLEYGDLPLAKVLVACPSLKLSDSLKQDILCLEDILHPKDKISDEFYYKLMRNVRDDTSQN